MADSLRAAELRAIERKYPLIAIKIEASLPRLASRHRSLQIATVGVRREVHVRNDQRAEHEVDAGPPSVFNLQIEPGRPELRVGNRGVEMDDQLVIRGRRVVDEL